MQRKKGLGKQVKKKNLRVFIFVAALLLIVLATPLLVLNGKFKGNGDNGGVRNAGECRIDADCVKVQTTCCPCNMGGRESCVLASNVSAYKPKNCPSADELICVAMYGCNIKSCICNAGRCEAVPLQE